MRLILLVIILVPFFAHAQQYNIREEKAGLALVACKVGEPRAEPLYVIDGVPVEMFDLKLLDPAQIESVHIFKPATSAIINCNGSDRNVILIQLKKESIPVFNIVSKNEGTPVAGAVVVFKKKGAGNGNIIRYSDSLGNVDIKGLEKMAEYDVLIEAFTFQSYKDTVRLIPGMQTRIALEQKALELQEVVVSANYVIRCGFLKIECGGIVADSSLASWPAKATADRLAMGLSASLYPNPVVRGRPITVTINPQAPTQARLEVYSLNGQLMFQQTSAFKAGYQAINIPVNAAWAKGVYVLSAKTKEGMLVSERFVVE